MAAVPTPTPLPRQRISVLIGDVGDPFWGQVMEGMYQAAHEHNLDLDYLQENLPTEPNPREEADLLRELTSQNIDILIHWGTSPQVIKGLLQHGTRLIQLTESDLTHPNAYAPLGLNDAAALAAEHIARQLQGTGRVALFGGMADSNRHERGRSRVQGFSRVLVRHPGIKVAHTPCPWHYEAAYEAAYAAFGAMAAQADPANTIGPDAIFGLSDTVALAARDAARELGMLPPGCLLVGLNGDPAALKEIAQGSMHATVETSAIDLGRDAVELALRLRQGKTPPNNFPYRVRLVTAENVQEASAQKLYALSAMPQRMINLNRQNTQQQTLQLETSIELMRSVGGILDPQKLSFEASERIRASYGYDTARLLRVEPDGKTVQPLGADYDPANFRYIGQDAALAEVMRSDTPVLTTSQNSQHSGHTRLLMPIHFGGQVTHILEMASQTTRQHRRADLANLQSLADLVGIAIRNAELYQESTSARVAAQVAEKAAEKADQLKSRLLANVSAELRTPLKNIIHHTRQAKSVLHAPASATNPGSHLDPYLGEIEHNSDTLNRLISDLLDLSRAEMNELSLNSHILNPAPILREAFTTLAGRQQGSNVRWLLDLPHTLPFITADPQRLHQVFINLLAQAARNTRSGSITLAAKVRLPYLCIGIEDTGAAMPQEVRDALFDPVNALISFHGEKKNLGIGLTIARRLVALHSGSIRLRVRPGGGNLINVLLPLPTLSGEVPEAADEAQAALPTILAQAAPHPAGPAANTTVAPPGTSPAAAPAQSGPTPSATRGTALAADTVAPTPAGLTSTSIPDHGYAQGSGGQVTMGATAPDTPASDAPSPVSDAPSLTNGYARSGDGSPAAPPPVALVPCNAEDLPQQLAELCAPFGLAAQPITNTMLLAADPPPAAALACQMGHTNAAAWGALQRLAADPTASRLPFLFFPQGQGHTSANAVQPAPFATLRSLVESLKPATAENNQLLIIEGERKSQAKLQAAINTALPHAIVTINETASDALRLLQTTEPPALIVMALNLEDMDGFDLLQRLRAAEPTASVPVALYTLRALTAADVRLMDHDKVLFITKNLLTQDELAERLQAALDDDGLLPRLTSGLVKRAIAFIHENYQRGFTLQQITYELGVSKSYFSLLFRREMGLSLWDYLNRYRVLKAKELLRNTTLPVNEISQRVGFEDFSYFGRLFGKQCQCSPREYRKKRTRPVG